MRELNEQATKAAEALRLRTRKLEDGELVLPVGRGGHAGAWGAAEWYVFLPSKRHASELGALGLRLRTGDAEVLAFGTQEHVIAVVNAGPAWRRAKRLSGRPGAPEHLASFSFRASRGAGDPSAASDPATGPVGHGNEIGS